MSEASRYCYKSPLRTIQYRIQNGIKSLFQNDSRKSNPQRTEDQTFAYILHTLPLIENLPSRKIIMFHESKLTLTLQDPYHAGETNNPEMTLERTSKVCEYIGSIPKYEGH